MKRRYPIAAAIILTLCLALSLASCGRLSVDDVRGAPTSHAASAIASAVTKDESSQKIVSAVAEAIRDGSVEASLAVPSGTLSAKAAASESEGRAAITLALNADGRQNEATLFIERDRAVLSAPSILGGAYGIHLGGEEAADETPPRNTAEYDLRVVTEFCERVSELLGRIKDFYDAGGYAIAATETLDRCVTAAEEREIALGEEKTDSIAVDYRLTADDLAELGVPLSSLLEILRANVPALSSVLGEDSAVKELSATVFIDPSSRRALRIESTLDAGIAVRIDADFTPQDGEDVSIHALGATLALTRRVGGGEISHSLRFSFIGVKAALDLAYKIADGTFALDLTTSGLPFDKTARVSGTLAVADEALTVEATSISLDEREAAGVLTLVFRPGEKIAATPECEFVSDLGAADWEALAASVVANGENIRAITAALPALVDEALGLRSAEAEPTESEAESESASEPSDASDSAAPTDGGEAAN